MNRVGKGAFGGVWSVRWQMWAVSVAVEAHELVERSGDLDAAVVAGLAGGGGAGAEPGERFDLAALGHLARPQWWCGCRS